MRQPLRCVSASLTSWRPRTSTGGGCVLRVVARNSPGLIREPPELELTETAAAPGLAPHLPGPPPRPSLQILVHSSLFPPLGLQEQGPQVHLLPER